MAQITFHHFLGFNSLSFSCVYSKRALLNDMNVILQLGEAGSKRGSNIAVQVPFIHLNLSVVYILVL